MKNIPDMSDLSSRLKKLKAFHIFEAISFAGLYLIAFINGIENSEQLVNWLVVGVLIDISVAILIFRKKTLGITLSRVYAYFRATVSIIFLGVATLLIFAAITKLTNDASFDMGNIGITTIFVVVLITSVLNIVETTTIKKALRTSNV